MTMVETYIFIRYDVQYQSSYSTILLPVLVVLLPNSLVQQVLGSFLPIITFSFLFRKASRDMRSRSNVEESTLLCLSLLGTFLSSEVSLSSPCAREMFSFSA